MRVCKGSRTTMYEWFLNKHCKLYQVFDYKTTRVLRHDFFKYLKGFHIMMKLFGLSRPFAYNNDGPMEHSLIIQTLSPNLNQFF